MMQRIKAFMLAVVLLAVIACTCSACVPPFIDGQVEAQDYFENTVPCTTFSIDPSAEGGFNTSSTSALSLEVLTDDDEDNVVSKRYYSFTFTAKEDITLQLLAFIVEPVIGAVFNFQLVHNTSTFSRSIDLSAGGLGSIEFDNLNLQVTASDEVLIVLADPLSADVEYRLDTVIFVI